MREMAFTSGRIVTPNRAPVPTTRKTGRMLLTKMPISVFTRRRLFVPVESIFPFIIRVEQRKLGRAVSGIELLQGLTGGILERIIALLRANLEHTFGFRSTDLAKGPDRSQLDLQVRVGDHPGKDGDSFRHAQRACGARCFVPHLGIVLLQFGHHTLVPALVCTTAHRKDGADAHHSFLVLIGAFDELRNLGPVEIGQ